MTAATQHAMFNDPPAMTPYGLDQRLADPWQVSATLALLVREQHTRPAKTKSCPYPPCSWSATRRQRQCRSYVVADALVHHRPIPPWRGDDDTAPPALRPTQPDLFGGQ